MNVKSRKLRIANLKFFLVKKPWHNMKYLLLQKIIPLFLMNNQVSLKLEISFNEIKKVSLFFSTTDLERVGY